MREEEYYGVGLLECWVGKLLFDLEHLKIG